MATRSLPRRKAKPSPDSAHARPTRAAQRKARDHMIQVGAFAKPLNRLVHRDPVETIRACRQAIHLLAHADPTQVSDDLKIGKAYMYQTVVDALESLELALDGYWGEGAASRAPTAEAQT